MDVHTHFARATFADSAEQVGSVEVGHDHMRTTLHVYTPSPNQQKIIRPTNEVIMMKSMMKSMMKLL